MTKTITIELENNSFADIVPGKSIRLYGERKAMSYRAHAVKFDITFEIGATAEYDSYNLSYLGTIEKITAKTVTIRPRHGRKARRLRLSEFNWRNRHFDLEAIRASNADTMMHI